MCPVCLIKQCPWCRRCWRICVVMNIAVHDDDMWANESVNVRDGADDRFKSLTAGWVRC